MHGRHVGLTSVPHGAKSYLAAALALAPDGGADLLGGAGRGDRRPGGGGAGRVARRPGARRGAGAADLARLRAQRAGPRRDGRPRRGARGVARRQGEGARRQRPGAASRRRSPPTTCPPSSGRSARGTRIGLDALLAELLERGYTPVLEVAGRGEFARRGGIVDVFPPSAPLPVRIELFGDEIDSCAPSTPPTSAASRPSARSPSCRRPSSCCPAGGADEIRARLGRTGRAAARAPRAGPGAVRRRRGDRSGRRSSEGRALPAGDAAEVWARLVAPHTGLDHLDPSTLFVLDEPGDLADAADFLWRQAEERHARAGGGRATCPGTGRRRTSRRATGRRACTARGRWSSPGSPRRARPTGMAFASKGLTSRRPVRLARAGAPAGPDGAAGRRRRALAGRAGPRRARERPGAAPRGAAGRGRARRRHRQPGRRGAAARAPSPSSSAASTAASRAARTASPLVTDRELFGTVRVRRPKAMRRVVPRDILERLTPGDIVVHIDHGIARYEQMLRRGERGPGARLPRALVRGRRPDLRPGRADQPRVAATPAASTRTLSRLGGTDWLRTKQRVRKAVNDLAEELLALYAKREAAAGLRVRAGLAVAGRDGGLVPVRGDAGPAARRRSRSRPTWRPAGRWTGWSSATSGYGKTEVALRAAFKATQDGKQVAVLVPTTVLAGQHFTDVQPAVRGVPADGPAAVAVRGREGPGGDGRGARAPGRSTSSSGRTGCCRKDVAFRDLGLVVVDEEQRFGVAAKERLKQLRSAVDVLTLSRHADPADAQPRAGRHPGPVASSRPRPRTGCRSRPGSRRRRPGSSATRSCASSTAAARCSTSTTGSRRSRRRPSSCGGCCPARGSSSGTGRWARARSRR